MLALLLSGGCSAIASAEAGLSPTISAEDLPHGFTLKILPQVELVSGTLLLTTWPKTLGPVGSGNEYAHALRQQLAAFEEHRAIDTAQRLIDRGFTYDLPMAFALFLGAPPDLPPRDAFPAWMHARAGDTEILEIFREALVDLASQSDFMAFFQVREPELRALVAGARRGYDPVKVAGWMEDFYGYGADFYHTVLAPTSFPAGGYGAGLLSTEGHVHVFNIARAADTDGGRNILPGGRDLEVLAIHEWGHSFSDPAVLSHPDLIQNLSPHYESVEGLMATQHYHSLASYVTEQVLRGIDAVARQDLYGDSEYRNYIRSAQNRGFHLTEMVAEELADYSANRGVYPTFREFAPVLLNRMAQEAPRRTPPRPRIHPGMWLRLLLGLVALVGVAWWFSVGIRRRRERIEGMEDHEEG